MAVRFHSGGFTFAARRRSPTFSTNGYLIEYATSHGFFKPSGRIVDGLPTHSFPPEFGGGVLQFGVDGKPGHRHIVFRV